jgi:hypothetical protein
MALGVRMVTKERMTITMGCQWKEREHRHNLVMAFGVIAGNTVDRPNTSFFLLCPNLEMPTTVSRDTGIWEYGE